MYENATYTITYSRGTNKHNEQRFQRKGVKASRLAQTIRDFQNRGEGIHGVVLDEASV